MKMKINIVIILLATLFVINGCASAIQPSQKPEKKIGVVNSENADQSEDENNLPEISDDQVMSNEIITEETTDTPSVNKHTAIVWLGDSLTQGSLGHNNDNLANAPYERLKKNVDIPVEGYGMYGVNTHDIFWVYHDESQMNQKIDNNKIYVFWVGSNDWVVDGEPNSNTEPVIKDIDKFIADGDLTDYVVIGTTSRWKLGDLCIPINNDLRDHYGEHYLDIIDIINKFGYCEDNTHLSQASYDSIADAVLDKMKALGYI